MLTMLSIYLFTRFFKKPQLGTSFDENLKCSKTKEEPENGYWQVALPSTGR